jgi:SPP1 gp7 family putative phage head morphogenesis protein
MLAVTLNLASRVRRPSKRPITLANIKPTQAQALSLLTIYARATAPWTAAAARIVAEYERTLTQLSDSIGRFTDSPSTTGDAIDSVAAEIQRLVLLLTPELRQWALRVESVHRGKWVSSVLSATDVDLNTVLTAGDVNDTVEASLNWNVSLIRDVSDETRRRISNIVFAGFQQRKAAADIAKEISEAIGMARSRARRIAGDQTVKLGARLNQARQEQAGISSFKWRHSAKRHPRSWHLHRDGKVYPWENSGIPADDMPGVPPFCGCTAQGVVTPFDDE